MKDIYGFNHGHDAYGFEKRARGDLDDLDDLDDAAYFHGFNGPSYSDDPGTPVNMSLINPGKGSRVGHGIGSGILGGLGGTGLGGMIGATFGPTGALVGAGIGGVVGALGGGVHGYNNAPKELILRHGAAPVAPAPAAPAEPPKMAAYDVYGFTHKRDIYGFEKRAWGDLDDAAYFHGFNGPSYSDDPGTPVNMSLINPSKGSRVGHGIGGGILGGLGGAGLGMAAGSAFGGSGVGAAVGGLGGAILGGLHGYHNAPKELILRHGAAPTAPAASAEPPKMASYDVYGFATKEALAAPGLLGQMSSAVSRMGKATSIAAQRAGNAFQAERGMSKLTGGQLPNSGLGRSLISAGQAGVDSLMKSQAGRRVLGTGVGLGAAGTLAAGTAAYNGLKAHNDANNAPYPAPVARQALTQLAR